MLICRLKTWHLLRLSWGPATGNHVYDCGHMHDRFLLCAGDFIQLNSDKLPVCNEDGRLTLTVRLWYVTLFVFGDNLLRN